MPDGTVLTAPEHERRPSAMTCCSIRLIGLAEILGAIGLALPAAVHIASILVPLAAVGLALVMAGAAAVNAPRKEAPMIAVNAVLLVLAVVVAWGRFRPYSSMP